MATAMALLLGYASWMSSRLRGDPLFSIQAYHRHVRLRWVAWIMADPSRGILGVQTLRNSTMGATFLASTVLLLLGGALSLVGHPDALGILSSSLETAASRHEAFWNFKVLLLVADLFVATFAFVMAVRLFAHISFQLALPPEETPHGVTVARVSGMLDRAGSMFSLGLRSCYLAMPLVMWLFGPVMLVVATLVLVLVMSRLDLNLGPVGEA